MRFFTLALYGLRHANHALRLVPGLLGLALLTLLPAALHAEESAPRAVLVTGASSGIGLRITEVLSANGYVVYAGARKEADLERLEAMDNVESIRLDVTVPAEIDAAVALVEKQGRGLYGLVNNAGVVLMGPLIEVPVEELEWVFEVNVYGPYRVTRAFAPLIIESQGRVVNISSITGFVAGGLQGHYSMSKHALEAYTDSLAAEMKRFGVHVSAIEPGSFASNAGKKAVERLERQAYWDENTAYKKELAFMKSAVANKQGGKDPVDVANAVMDALSSPSPKRRYLVADAPATHMTISAALERILQLNQDQPHSKSREQLGAMIDTQIKKQEAGKANTAAPGQ